MSVPDFKISLRICGDDLDPKEISVLLHCQPTGGTRKGSRLENKAGWTEALTGVWYLDAGTREGASLADSISSLLSKIDVDASVWRSLAERFKCELFIGVFLRSANQGFSITPDLLRTIVERHLRLAFDVYAH